MSFRSKTAFYIRCLTLLSTFAGLFSLTFGEEPRNVAPGVMNTIRPVISYADTYQWATMPEVLNESPSYTWAENLFYNKEIWCLELKFKPVRLIDVDFPMSNGTLKKVKVWYMVYSVTNTGKCVRNEIDVKADNNVTVMVQKTPGLLEPQKYDIPKNNLSGIYKPVVVDYSAEQPGADGKVRGTVRFIPNFVLVSDSIRARFEYEKTTEPGSFFKNRASGAEEAVYYDQFLPLAFVKVVAYEDPNKKFENSVTFPRVDIKPGQTVWGIATWADIDRESKEFSVSSVDPRIDKFTIYVSGLSNAIRWEDDPAAHNSKAKFLEGRTIYRKVLKLNFVRPGDEFIENSKEFHFGAPGELDHSWIYL